MSSLSNDERIPNRGPTLTATSTVLLFLTTLFFATRLFWRLRQSIRWWDDLFIALAYLALVVQTTFGYLAVHHGFGIHRADLSIDMFQHAMFWFWMYQIVYKILGGLTKLSFCALYLYMFRAPGMKKTQIAVWAVGSVIAVGSLVFAAVTIGQCSPVRRNWDRSVSGHCVRYVAFWISHAVFNTVMDVVVYVLPMRPLWDSQMARRDKRGLVIVFALGAFTILASIIRISELPRSASSTADPTWGSLPALLWTEIEANTAVICCCLPALKAPAVMLWRHLRGKTGDGTSGISGDQPDVKSKWLPWTPGKSKGFGVHTNIRASPDNTWNRTIDNQELEDLQKPTKPEMAGAGGITKTTRVEMSSNRDSRFGKEMVSGDLGRRSVSPGPYSSEPHSSWLYSAGHFSSRPFNPEPLLPASRPISHYSPLDELSFDEVLKQGPIR